MEKRIGKLTRHIFFFQVSVAWMLSYPPLSLSLYIYRYIYIYFFFFFDKMWERTLKDR